MVPAAFSRLDIGWRVESIWRRFPAPPTRSSDENAYSTMWIFSRVRGRLWGEVRDWLGDCADVLCWGWLGLRFREFLVTHVNSRYPPYQFAGANSGIRWRSLRHTIHHVYSPYHARFRFYSKVSRFLFGSKIFRFFQLKNFFLGIFSENFCGRGREEFRKPTSSRHHMAHPGNGHVSIEFHESESPADTQRIRQHAILAHPSEALRMRCVSPYVSSATGLRKRPGCGIMRMLR